MDDTYISTKHHASLAKYDVSAVASPALTMNTSLSACVSYMGAK